MRAGGLMVGTAEARLDKKLYSGTFVTRPGRPADEPAPPVRAMPEQPGAEGIEDLSVMTPPGYEDPANQDKRYLVMYGFGIGGLANPSTVPSIQRYAPRAIAEYGLDAVINYVDRNYRTVAGPHGRAMMGYSAGPHIAFRHPDRVDKVGVFVFMSHPLRDSGWPKQKELERLAILRGLECIRKTRPAIIFMAGSAEETQRLG